MHGLPLTYNKDMQEDKEHLFDAADTLELCLAGGRRDARHDRASGASGWPRRPPTSSWPRPTSPTCWCAAASRSARPTASSPGWCARAVDSGRPLSALTEEELREHSPVLDEEFYAVLSDGAWLESKVSEGGTSAAAGARAAASGPGRRSGGEALASTTGRCSRSLAT